MCDLDPCFVPRNKKSIPYCVSTCLSENRTSDALYSGRKSYPATRHKLCLLCSLKPFQTQEQFCKRVIDSQVNLETPWSPIGFPLQLPFLCNSGIKPAKAR